ncbi:hypothetical protein BT96DRAFT_934280 [Gymnopus androsaceus JB14]|uniref:MFS general substrate transporter n=1 Tax=Gymnopus androsaceus JB14 TaxID=1447944 RepID=A0A6A4I6Y4_9AGAR|nr:hypothetical protein BT96DRAFT_934280 [Gymnopus androsaceus JB14]
MLEQEEKQHKPLRSYLCLFTTLDLSNITSQIVRATALIFKAKITKQWSDRAGNDLNYITTAWTCGYIIGQIPSNLLITRIRPSIWVAPPSRTENATHLIVIRFFVGLAESTFFPGIQYIIGGWYKGDEIGKRSCIFTVHIKPLSTNNSLHFCFSCIRSAQWSIWLTGVEMLCFSPSTKFLDYAELAHNTQPSFLYSESQLKLARKRMDEIGRKPPAKFTKAKVLNFFKTWHIYVLVPSLIGTIVYILVTSSITPVE